MGGAALWLAELDDDSSTDGLVLVRGYRANARPPEEVSVMEKAASYGAHSVLFEAGQNGRPPSPQAFVFVSDEGADEQEFAEVHKRLWSWGGVPLLFRRTLGQVQLFRCAHDPDFIQKDGSLVCNPIRSLRLASAVDSDDAIWDASLLRNGTFWDDPTRCNLLLSGAKTSHKRLVDAVEALYTELATRRVLQDRVRRRLLIVSLMIAYLEERGVFGNDYFGSFLQGATRFFEILADGPSLVQLLRALHSRFNGSVFEFDEQDLDNLRTSRQLVRFASLVSAFEEPTGQFTLWRLYSFRDLPIEVISHIYQLFVSDKDVAVYTPPFLVRLMMEEAMSWDRLDRLMASEETILDPACGSGVFLVEAYKRLVLHWRSRHRWKKPDETTLKNLLFRVHGVDVEQGAIELAGFSLCLALCDALEPEAIRSSIKLFPALAGVTLHNSCFFEAKRVGSLKQSVGIVVGNPPFKSKLETAGAKRAYADYQERFGPLPDKQVAYLFLHEAMELVVQGGVLSMLQQYGFLYNQKSSSFRRRFFATWNVREVLDFTSVRGLFQKDTKVVVVVATSESPDKERKLLHGVFRRTGRVDAEQGFDIDYYDLHWISRRAACENDDIWRSNLLGGGRVLSFVDRLRRYRSFAEYAAARGWDFGEGFIEGQKGKSGDNSHIVGKRLLPSEALTTQGILRDQIVTNPEGPIEGPRSKERFSPPLLLIREQEDLPSIVWNDGYLTYKNQIVGFAAPRRDIESLTTAKSFLERESVALRAYVAAISVKLFTQKATTLSAADIFALPYPETLDLELSTNERIIAEDIVRYQRDFIRLGEKSESMLQSASGILKEYARVYATQVSEIYKEKPLRALEPYVWPGVVCQPFVFGQGRVRWDGAGELAGAIDKLLQEKRGESLSVTRIAKLYDESFIFLLKPDRLRYWTKSIALRDADESLADLREQGF